MKQEKLRKNILLVGSDSDLACNLIESIADNSDKLTTISRSSSNQHRSDNHFSVDLSRIDEVLEVCNKIKYFTYDIMIYFPAIFRPGPLKDCSENSIIEEINVNLTSAILLSRNIVPNMVKAKNGTLLYLGSSSSYFGFKNTSIYCSTKHGLLGFTRSLSEELRETGIKVSCISPGSINTKMSIPLHSDQNPKTFIDPIEISNLIMDLIYNTPKTMWQEEIIIKRRIYK